MSNVTDIYGSLVFDKRTMRERLPKETYKELLKTVEDGAPLDPQIANVVAHAMKEWAIEKGATHFSHWFQPLSGVTSEKHDAFIQLMGDGSAIQTFSGKELIQGEPDASSFPNGGLRATFEARGYTAWDPTSYAFIKDEVLCIPTAFGSYTGDALDKKTPLLRSMKAIEEQVNRMQVLFGDKPSNVTITLGAEQEFFLIPERDYAAREDLVMTGRTLFGNRPCKGQELEEHYFGAIRPSVNSFMKELDDELWKLGISARTKHNEVAPAQHELAPIYAGVNRGVDENLLTMEKMRLLAGKYGFACLLHEKPFEGINGSGKHNNWSITAGGKNLLEPGDNPTDNLRFLVILTAIIEAVDEYQELIRMSIASAGNDHRLGADEAPPAIVSIFLGDDLGAMVDAIIAGEEFKGAGGDDMDFGVDVLPTFSRDNSDRNRTSPFAFTGNKFEFRMPGSAVNLSDCNMILNTAMAKSLSEFADAMEGKTGEEFEHAAFDYVKKTLADHQRIIFNGDGYASDWEQEAERRGLANNKTTADALPCFVEKKSIDLFEQFGVLTEAEVRCRYEVKLEKYCKLINIESRTMRRMLRRAYLPAISAYAAKIAGRITEIKTAMPDIDTTDQEDHLRRMMKGLHAVQLTYNTLAEKHAQIVEMDDLQEAANAYAHELVPAMDAVRQEVDQLEILVPSQDWPVPSYNDILFYG